MTKTTMIVIGPQGCGKTKNANRIAKAFKLEKVIDGWQPGDPIPPKDALVLTNAPLKLDSPALKKYRTIDFKYAMEEVYTRERV